MSLTYRQIELGTAQAIAIAIEKGIEPTRCLWEVTRDVLEVIEAEKTGYDKGRPLDAKETALKLKTGLTFDSINGMPFRIVPGEATMFIRGVNSKPQQ